MHPLSEAETDAPDVCEIQYLQTIREMTREISGTLDLLQNSFLRDRDQPDQMVKIVWEDGYILDTDRWTETVLKGTPNTKSLHPAWSRYTGIDPTDVERFFSPAFSLSIA